ncbi:NAD(P)H:quinone oxidoreductase, type IV [Cryptococcus sp. DSM 104549]
MPIDKQALLKKLEVPQRDEEAEVWQNSRWLNRDNVPLPPSRRNWGVWSYCAFWVTSGVNVSGWAAGASLMSLGLTVATGQAMIVSCIGHALVAMVVFATGQLGSHWHIGFPLANRMSWGMRASYFPLVNRIILSFTWTATQGWLGAQCLKVLIGSMAPGIYTMKNVMPASTGMTSADFLCFALFTIITIPCLLIPPERLHRPMVVVASCSTITALTLFIYSLARAGGGGPLLKSDGLKLVGVQPAKGSALAWAIFHGISTSLGGVCAGILNMSDYTRFAQRPNDPLVSQAIVTPIVGVLTAVIGIVCASSAAANYPTTKLLWTPYGLLTAMQTYGDNATRAAVFFASLVFTLAQLGINIPGNLIAGGIDLASLWPKYINIRRGAYITLAISIAMNPWALMSGATAFISVMSGYAVFIGPMTGIMVWDYFFVHKRKVKLSNLYECTPNSIYYYYKGVNWRAIVAWVFGVAPAFPGFIVSVGGKITVPIGAMRVYYLCWPLGFTISGLLYTILCKISPLPGIGEVDEEDVFGTFGERDYLPPLRTDAEGAPSEGEKEHPEEKALDANVNVIGIRERGLVDIMAARLYEAEAELALLAATSTPEQAPRSPAPPGALLLLAPDQLDSQAQPLTPNPYPPPPRKSPGPTPTHPCRSVAKPVIVVAYYSTYGHIATLADAVIKGAASTGAVVKPYSIKETLSEEILSKMHAGSSLKPKHPTLTPDDLKEADGVIFGAPTRYGRLPAQVSAFFDQCGGLWATGGLVGKFASTFTSTAGQHGGQETTALTTLPFFAHLAYLPIGYTNQTISALDQVQGGSPYGASTIVGADGSRQPLPAELEVAEWQGKYFSEFVGASTSKPVIVVAFYSTYGHITSLAEQLIKGAEASGALVKPYFIQETLPEEVLSKMYAGSSLKPKYPILTPNDLKEADGIVIGAPTRFGQLPAQVDNFFDQCGQLWATGALVGKFVTTFTSTAGQHSGQETTPITSLPFFIHHGLSYVPIGYANPAISNLDAVQGGTPYGASTIAASDGSRQPSAVELEIAEFQGKYFADFVGTFVKGKNAAAAAPAKTTAASTSTGTTAAAATTGAAAKGTSTPAAKSTPAATEKPAAAAAKPAASQQKKKKGGLFSCCGDSNID